MKYTQAQIKKHYLQAKKYLRKTRPAKCEQCGTTYFLTPSHTIAQKDCKNYHVTELIWNPDNIVIECQDCHRAWENGTATRNSTLDRMGWIQENILLVQSRMEEHHPGEGEKKARELFVRYATKIQDQTTQREVMEWVMNREES